MSFPSKVITIFCALQFFFIVTGYLATTWAVRTVEKFGVAIATDLNFIRTYGPWFLLVPVAWGIVAITRARSYGGETAVSGLQFFIGLGLTIVVVFIFAVNTLHALLQIFGDLHSLSWVPYLQSPLPC